MIPRLGRVLGDGPIGTAPATRPSPEIDASLRRLATWVFIAPSLFGFVYFPDAHKVYLKAGQIGLTGLTLLFLFTIATRSIPFRTMATIATTTTLLFAVLLLYAYLWPTIRGSAIAEPSQKSAFVFVAYCSAAVAYALVFYKEEIFVDVFWKAARLAVIIAIGAYLAHVLFQTGWLVHREYGTPRLQGLLDEPSGWAPFLPALLLLSLGRRRYIWAAVFLVTAALTKSPTVLLGMAVSVPAYYALAARQRSHRLLVFTSVTAFYAIVIYWLQGVDIDRPLSANLIDQFVVRLASGLNAMKSGGTHGRNDRFASTQAIIDELSARDWLLTGIGPGSDGYIVPYLDVYSNALPVYLLASFGVIGVLVFAVVIVITVALLRKFGSLRIFLPFIVASLINSAGGWEGYKFVIVAIVVSGGIAVRTRARSAADRSALESAGNTPSTAGPKAAQ